MPSGGGPRSLEIEEQRCGPTLGRIVGMVDRYVLHQRGWNGDRCRCNCNSSRALVARGGISAIARRNQALEFIQWWRRRGANLLSLRELIGEDRRVIAQHRELH